eukprot:Phypoly_transcript_16440.p1 GENE.Phypoly_transcript_16440~~Phypoly_transcript_16440.p1  ORF type:complete len:224 (+),score=39.31 Phypoly_transcript_16440:127-798(+)
MSKQTIFFSRHGIREDWGPHRQEWLKTAIRPYDPSLAPEGYQQAKELGAYYRSIHSTTPIHRILSSPLVRTLQTSTAIANELDVKICVEYGAMEWLGGETVSHLEPLPIDQLATMFPRIDTSYKSTVNLPPALTKEALHDWCKDTITKIADRFPDETIIIVTHAAPLIALARGLLGPESMVRTGVCSVSKVVNCGKEKDSNWAIEVNGSTTHLSKGEQFHWTF